MSASQRASNRLNFKGKLHTKGITTDALLKRIKTVQSELASLDQENVDTESLKDMCLQLVHPTLTLHKDKSVKASTACCLADMLRLYAPNAPFTADELKVSTSARHRQAGDEAEGREYRDLAEGHVAAIHLLNAIL